MMCMLLLLCGGFFFFKQKTAYEMRISDWSSDVCSSDLAALTGVGIAGKTPRRWVAFSMLGFLKINQTRRVQLAKLRRRSLSASQISAAMKMNKQIGRASCRARVCQYVSIWVGDVSIQKKKQKETHTRSL